MERIYHEGKLGLNETFCPFSESDLALLDKGDNQTIQKCFSVEGVVGSLHLNITRVMPWDFRHDYSFDRDRIVSPYSMEPITKETIADYPFRVTMCFNDTADVSPSFKLTFPDTPRPIFYAFVCDWDKGGVLKDATQYEFEKGDFENSVRLVLPDSRAALLGMQMEVMDRFWQYPDVAIKL